MFMKNTDKIVDNAVGIFAFIGVIATIIFTVNLFNNEDPDSICGAHLGKIDELESEIINLKDEIDALEYQNLELEFDLDEATEERDFYEDYYVEKEGIEYPKLTDGTKK